MLWGIITPSVIYPSGQYHDAMRVMAWLAAGWAAAITGKTVVAFGPPSISDSVDHDICRMAGCLDSSL